MKLIFLLLVFIPLFWSCNSNNQNGTKILSGPRSSKVSEKLKPVVVTEPAKHDTDDPAIWIHPDDPSQSLIIGTDKDKDGALYVYDLEGKIIKDKVVRGLQRPNNVDIEYGLMIQGQPVDIAVTTERLTNKIRIFALPDMQPLDDGGIEVFEGQHHRAPMGIALYKKPSDGKIYAFVGRKNGPMDSTYIWQYLLESDGSGNVQGRKVRVLGNYSGHKEIESIAVDDELGYVYYSDEGIGVRKYYADPDSTNVELALFATSGFAEDHEGISIYPNSSVTGYILVSDQQANKFHIFTREGTTEDPHSHQLVKIIDVSTHSSDGSEVTPISLNAQFPKGMFVAMSDEKTFHFYSWKDILDK